MSHSSWPQEQGQEPDWAAPRAPALHHRTALCSKGKGHFIILGGEVRGLQEGGRGARHVLVPGRV